jgi:phosphoglucosamine mutase
VMSNFGLERALIQKNIPFTRTQVGDRYVLEELLKKGWKLGGESSGHIVNLHYTTTGDGIISALQILRIMQMSGKNLYDLKQGMVKHPQVLINVAVYGEKELKQYPKVSKAVLDAEKNLAGKGRVLLRASGTEPVVRVMVEGEEERSVREIAESLAGVVEKELNG